MKKVWELLNEARSEIIGGLVVAAVLGILSGLSALYASVGIKPFLIGILVILWLGFLGYIVCWLLRRLQDKSSASGADDVLPTAQLRQTLQARPPNIDTGEFKPELSQVQEQRQDQIVRPIGTTAFVIGGNMEMGRHHHISALLPNGDVLIVGGYSYDSIEANVLASAELYSLASGTFARHGRMIEQRCFAAATSLDNNMVLISGGVGENGQALDTAELYSPVTGTFSLIGQMTTARRGHTATMLQNGRVLIAGGSGGNTGSPLASAEIYDPIENTFTLTGSMTTARLTEHTPNAVLLKDGRVLVTGGYDGVSGAIASMEFYDPDNGVFVTGGNMALKRAGHTLTLLSNGKVLIAGGYEDKSGYLASAELYDPATSKVALMQNMKVPHFHHTATLLSGDRVLVVGGNFPLAEMYDPKTDSFSEFGALTHSRYLHTAVLLRSNQVLIIGGTSNTHSLASVEISPVLESAHAFAETA